MPPARDKPGGGRSASWREALAELKQSEAMIQTLFRISKKLNATLDVDKLLDELAQEAIQIVRGESGFAGLRTADGMTIHKYFREGVAIPYDYTWPEGRGIPGWVLKYRIPYGTSDAANDQVLQHDLSINAGVRSLICTPILDSVGGVLGYFDIRNKTDGNGFTPNDQEMLMALSPAASIAIQNALAYGKRLQVEAELKSSHAQLRALAAKLEAVREEERTTIARELHDQLGQALTALKLDLARLTDRLVDKDAALAREAVAITAQMDALVKTVRRIATELRPGVLDNLGLAASIEWQSREFQRRTGIECVVTLPDDDLLLTRGQATALFRIFQETLTNVTRHAQASRVAVELRATTDWLTLMVHDNGRGIQRGQMAGANSLGLLGMRERTELLGGSFDIRGTPSHGTTVTVAIPRAPATQAGGHA
ncbi:MAG: GAF domain-containing sensor histidine kinase [Chloroflexi bacterium]|nr:GAF domain-containing sensor histidine kinase [Chloroflexota bacterium]